VPELDFSPLGNLADTYRQARQQAAREQVLGQLGQGSGPLDYSQASRALLAAGDTQGGMSLAALAQQQYLHSPEYLDKIKRQGLQAETDFGPKTFDITSPGPFGESVKQTVEKGPGGYRSIQVQPAQGAAPGATGGPVSGYFAPGVSKLDSTLSGDAYLKQFSPEVQSAVKNYLEGGTMPTGNPRLQGLAQMAKTIAQKYGPEVGIPADDAEFAARRKMRTDLAGSAPNSAGGILSNGKSAFEHLANLSDKMTDLGNYNGPNVPFGGAVAAAGNYIGNAITPTSETKGKVAAFNDNALKYGQEATKFYAGSGGGEAERMTALRVLNPTSSSANEQAAFLQTEKELMLGRLRQKEAQVRDTLGQSYLDRHPVTTPDLVESIYKIDSNIAKLRGQEPPPKPEAPAARPQAQANPNAWRTKETVTAARANPQAALAEAKAAIASGAPREAVIQRLKQVGVDPSGL
jgi:hypothetical protein